MTNGTIEKPNGVISSPPIVSAPRGWIRPQVLLLRIPKTTSASPAAESATPTTSSSGGFSTAGVFCRRRRRTRMAATITTSPANT